MKIIELLKSHKLNLSFEVFPPKTDSSFDTVKEAVEEIAKLKPAFMSVTYGAGGGTGKYTLDIAKDIKEKYGVSTLAHLTCVSSSKEAVKEKIRELKDFGIENVMALRGDLLPTMSLESSASWDYTHAVDLVRELRASDGEFCIGGACYPEVHPESRSQQEDIENLKLKVEAGCEFLTTQMFFDNNLLYNFLYKIREKAITVPVVPGIMPITNSKQIERVLKLSGCHIPQRFKAMVDKFGHDPKAMKQAGIAYATDQIIDLYANDIKNVHVYSMNNPDVAMKIQENLSYIIGR